MTNGSSSPGTMCLPKIRATIAAKTMPNPYMEKITSPAYPPNSVPASRAYTGSRALHDIKGATMIVTSLSRSDSSVRVAMIAGTLQPKPMIIGMNAFPWRPIACMIRSIRKAARAM